MINQQQMVRLGSDRASARVGVGVKSEYAMDMELLVDLIN